MLKRVFYSSVELVSDSFKDSKGYYKGEVICGFLKQQAGENWIYLKTFGKINIYHRFS